MRQQTKLLTILFLLLSCTGVTHAQTMNVVVGEVTYQLPVAQAGDITFHNGESLTIGGKVFPVNSISMIYMDETSVEEDAVHVMWKDGKAAVYVAGNVMRHLTVEADDARVAISQDDDLDEEITYALTGQSADGSFHLEGKYKAKVKLSDLSLTCADDAPIDISDGKRISLLVEGTNVLSDGTASTKKGCLYVKGHTEIDGTGTLSLTANGSNAHGLYSGEYLQLKKNFTGSIRVESAVKDGIHCGQYFQMNAGNVTVAATGDDGIQVESDEEYGEDDGLNGCCLIQGGTLDVSLTAEKAKGVCCDSILTVTDKFSSPQLTVEGAASAYAAKGLKADRLNLTAGTIQVNLAGKGIWDTDDQSTSACACLKANDLTMNGGECVLKATGSGGKGISGEQSFTMQGGELDITTSGGCYVYQNSREYTDYTQGLDNIGTGYRSSAKGIKIGTVTTLGRISTKTGTVTIDGGTIRVVTSTNGAEGIESKGTIDIHGGTVNVTAYDDAVNSGKNLTIDGGTVTVNGLNNDGLDANGDLWIQGGTIVAYGTTSPECGIDANEEENCHAYFTGGTLLAIGGGNSVPTANSSSTQAYVITTLSVTAGNTLTLSSTGTTLATFSVTRSYSSSGGGGGGGIWRAPATQGGQPGGGGGWQPGGGGGGMQGSSASVLVTCPGLTKGNSYTLSNGTSSTTVSALLYGSSEGRK